MARLTKKRHFSTLKHMKEDFLSNHEKEGLSHHTTESLPLCGDVICADGRNLPQIKGRLGGKHLDFRLTLPTIDHFQDTRF